MTQHHISILLKLCVHYKGRRVDRVQKIAIHSENRLKHNCIFLKVILKLPIPCVSYISLHNLFTSIAHTYLVQTLKELLQYVSSI